MKMSVYLNFDGQTEEAFQFYKSVFGGEFTDLMRMSGAPGAEKLSPGEEDRIMHISLPLTKDILLMGSDILPSAGHQLHKGNQVYISLHPDSKKEADRLFHALSEKGEIEMQIGDTFWGDYFGSLKDRYGILWMINFSPAAV